MKEFRRIFFSFFFEILQVGPNFSFNLCPPLEIKK